MSARTIFLSKLLGLYLILISLAMIAHKQATVESMNALVHNAPVLFVVGVIALLGWRWFSATTSGQAGCFQSS